MTQAKHRLSSAASESTPRNNAPPGNSKSEVTAERSKHDVGDKTARPGTSAEQQMNMKILEHALGVNPKLKNSPLARTARFGPASKSKARAASPRPQERATTAASVAASVVRDAEVHDPMKKRPPWNPSTLDTLYSPRKPDTSPSKSRDTSPSKGARDATPGRDAPPSSSGTSTKPARTAERLSPTSEIAPSQSRTPPHSRTADATGSMGSKGPSSKTDAMADKVQTPLESSSSISHTTAPSQAPPDKHAGSAQEVKTGVNEESLSSSVIPFTQDAPRELREDTVVQAAESRSHEGLQAAASSEAEPLGSEFLIPPEFQNLDRPLTRRDERPNTRRDDRPTTRGGLEERPNTRGGLEDRPTTRGLDGRHRSRFVSDRSPLSCLMFHPIHHF